MKKRFIVIVMAAAMSLGAIASAHASPSTSGCSNGKGGGNIAQCGGGSGGNTGGLPAGG